MHRFGLKVVHGVMGLALAASSLVSMAQSAAEPEGNPYRHGFSTSRYDPNGLNAPTTGSVAVHPAESAVALSQSPQLASEAATIVELARALKGDPNLIYEHVRDNIKLTPTWGVQKGAFGASLDGYGTAFDQASLMVALLRQSGFSDARFVKGRIELLPDQFRNMFGFNPENVCAVLRMLGNARIPTVNVVAEPASYNCPGGTSAFVKTTIEHVWVKVTVGGQPKVYDPSYKRQVIQPPMDIATAVSYSTQGFMDIARFGATVNSDYVQNLNRLGVQTELATYANRLSTYLRANAPSARLADVVGGASIVRGEAPVPYRIIDGSTVEWSSIPDTFRPLLRVGVPGASVAYRSDELQGRRLTIGFNTSFQPIISLDGALVATGSAQTVGSEFNADIKVVQNAFVSPPPSSELICSNSNVFCHSIPIKAGSGFLYVVANGWGVTGRGMIEYHRARMEAARQAGSPDQSEEVMGQSLALLASNWTAQSQQAADIAGRLAKVQVGWLHEVGIAGYNGAVFVDLPLTSSTVVSQERNLAKESAAFFSGAMHNSMIESLAVQQTSGASAVSTVKLIDQALQNGLRVYSATSTNYLGAVKNNLVACEGAEGSFQAAVNSGLRLVLPARCDLRENDWSGAGYFQIANGSFQAINALVNRLHGGFGTQTQVPAVVASNSSLSMPSPFESLLQWTGLSFGDPVDMTKGHYLYHHGDISTGVSGAFPESLSFERSYSSGAHLQKGPLGLGWAHNLAVSAAPSSDGFQGLGEDSALDAVSSIVELMVSVDLLSDTAQPLDKLLTATVGQRWFADQLLNNTVIVQKGLNGEVFVKLPDGSYNPPPGSPVRLTKNGDGSFSYELPDRTQLLFNPPNAANGANKIASYTLKSGLQAKFNYAGADLTSVENSLGRRLDIAVVGGKITGVSDGNGRSVSYGINPTTGNLDSFTDANLKKTTFDYDLPGRMTKVFYPSRPTEPFVFNVYDSLGRVQTQENARKKQYTYYFAGFRSEEVGPGNTSNVSYMDGEGRALRTIDPTGRVTTNIYDGAGRLKERVLPEGNKVQYVYDDATCASAEKRCTHNVKTVTQLPKPGSTLAPLVTSFTYEPVFNKVETATNARRKVTTYRYNPTHGGVWTVESPPDRNGLRPYTEMSYQSFSAAGFPDFYLPTGQTSKIDATRSVTNTTTYKTDNRYVPWTLTTDAGGFNLTTTYTYDAVGNLKAVDGPRTDVNDVTTMDYDNERRLTQTTNALGKLSKVGYDDDGRPIRKAAQVGSQWLVSCTRYTPTGNPERVWGPALTASDSTCPAEAAPVAIADTTYDDLDRPEQVTQHLKAEEGGNRVVKTGYYPNGQVNTIKRAVGTPKEQTYATTTYTANGLPETVTDARGYVTKYEYDGHDRRKKVKYPNPTVAGSASETDYEEFLFNESGAPTNMRRRDGRAVVLGYDDLDRLVWRQYPGEEADNVELNYDLLGRRTSAASGGHSVLYGWDKAGRLENTTAGGRQLSYAYDAAGNRTQITWPETTPFFVKTEYDALNRPTKMTDSAGAELANYGDYDDLSRRRNVTLGNGTNTSYGYDNQGALNALAHNLANTAQDVAFTYGRNQAQEIRTNTWTNDTYQWSPTGGTRDYGTANGLNQLSTLTYDGNGNLKSNGPWTWTYDRDNQLRSASRPSTSTAVTLLYDAAGRLRRESDGTAAPLGTTEFLYDGVNLVAEYDGAGKLLRRHVHGPGVDEPLVTYHQGVSAATKEWLYADHQGSVIASADSAGASTKTYSYSPYGETNQLEGSVFKYTGQVWSNRLGLSYYKARFYSPLMGRFMQTDPIGYEGGLNLYAYVGNSPIDQRDPTGLRPATDGEIAMLRSVFNDKVDYGKIDIRSGASIDPRTWPPIAGGFAVTLENSIHFSAKDYHADFSAAGLSSQAHLVHEVGHVYQYQNLPDYSWAKAGAEGLRNDTYKYSLEPGKSLLDYRYEQQATIFADYFFAQKMNSPNARAFDSILRPEGLGTAGSGQTLARPGVAGK